MEGIAILYLIGIAMNFIPLLIASGRNHPKTLCIGLICLFFGWTIIGWIIALVMACTDDNSKVNPPNENSTYIDENEKTN